MRPLRLEVEGFTVFRQPTCVEFEGADLFALAGPTGAGKTSVIDAVTFALYGAIPRLGDRRAVAPIVSQNLTEARVRLDFAVGQERYVAVRVVKATKSGATTAEARLERSDGPAGPDAAIVLAGSADEVTAEVTALLGLTYEHFITCVSLPQGQFARFLHDKPRDRQDLLVRLLGLGIYDQVASAARQRGALAKGQADVIEGQLAQLASATPEARAAAESRIVELAALAEKLDAARPELDRLAESAAAAGRRADELDRQLGLLEGVTPPDGVRELAETIEAVRVERSRLCEAEEQAGAALTRAEADLAELPDRRELDDRQRDLALQVELTATGERGRQAATEATGAVVAAVEAETVATQRCEEQTAALERVRVEQRAHALVPELAVGEPCPVCQQPVTELPDVSTPEVSAAEAAAVEATRQVKGATAALGEARTHQARVEEKLSRLEEELVAVSERLDAGQQLTADQVAEQLDRVASAEQEVAASRRADQEARRCRARVAARHDELVSQEAEARRAFDAARDGLAVLEPPSFERRDLAADWEALVRWGEDRRPALDEEATQLRAEAEGAGQEHTRRWAELAELCRASEVDPGRAGQWPGEAVAVARARAEDAVARIDADIAQADDLRRRQQEAVEQRQVAETLAGHLAANRFEKWLLDEAVVSLTAGASTILGELSGGGYALSVDTKSGGFTVIDHANASQARSARTLSGGETFLASLALALALADQVADLASGGTARLETLFLDEGFGTLDPDTLDVVAAALDELGARGRVVGLVTHVRELAERMPVRFEVRKVGASATVERVEGG